MLGWLGVCGVFGAPAKPLPDPVVLVVMDPLAKELACACVKGHGQRDYRLGRLFFRRAENSAHAQ